MTGIKQLSKSESAYINLRRIILDFSLIPGQSICIKRISGVLKISTTPLREALFGLEKDGYVVKSKNDSFHVTQINRDYVQNLFTYGKILHDHALRGGRPRASNSYYDDREASCNSCKSAFDIDSIYLSAQRDANNYFISKELSIFRLKASSIRSALQNSNLSLYSEIYGIFMEYCHKNCDLSDLFKELHSKKCMHSEQIARTVLSHAISRGKNIDSARSITPFDAL